jgi:hypothetical protein
MQLPADLPLPSLGINKTGWMHDYGFRLNKFQLIEIPLQVGKKLSIRRLFAEDHPAKL